MTDNIRKNFDFLLLDLFLKENIEFLQGARFQKIQQPTRQEFIFTLRNLGQNKKLYVNINPKFFHICFISKENEQKRFIQIPKQPPMFCMLLRKHLDGAKIVKVIQPENERILEFYFEVYNELSEKIYVCLAIELMGKHSNVILYNYDTNMIIGCAHNVGAEKSSIREIRGSLPYTYPPKNFNINFIGLSSNLEFQDNVNQFIDNFFAEYQKQEKIEKLKTKLISIVKIKIKKLETALNKIKNQSIQKEEANNYRKKGDLIMANLFHYKDFIPFIEVLDFETNSPLTIELDTTKTLKENANKYFKLYTKAKTGSLKSHEITQNLLMERTYLEQVLYSIENAQEIDEFLEIEDEITNNAKKNIQNKKDSSLPLSLNVLNFNIYVGKNNKQNDYIVSKLSRDEDLWFHVKNCAGSHVLLQIKSGQKINKDIIFECAKLAKNYSCAKNSSKVPVIYTKRKFLKKPPAAKPGYVTYKNEKEILIG